MNFTDIDDTPRYCNLYKISNPACDLSDVNKGGFDKRQREENNTRDKEVRWANHRSGGT